MLYLTLPGMGLVLIWLFSKGFMTILLSSTSLPLDRFFHVYYILDRMVFFQLPFYWWKVRLVLVMLSNKHFRDAVQQVFEWWSATSDSVMLSNKSFSDAVKQGSWPRKHVYGVFSRVQSQIIRLWYECIINTMCTDGYSEESRLESRL